MKKSKNSKSKSENSPAPPLEREDLLIVGIGASAGGIQALKEFFANVPADSGAAYVVILHLSPDHDSQLAEVLQTVAQIPVTQVKEKIRVEPNHVYVVPPNQSLSMSDGYIIVSPIHTIEERRAPVDIFFRTLAESHQDRAVAVVLSGTGANGSMGIKRVKECGGATFVQNPREAEFSEMPRNSIATELIDLILNVDEIPARIIAYKNSLGTVEIPVEAESTPEKPLEKALLEIFSQLMVRTGHNFSNYKRATVLRRIERRINVRNLSDLPEYAAFLRENPDETHSLLKDLLISVTNFFRDKATFQYLEDEVLPKVLEGKTSEQQVRVWVAGCATGEEAYSLAMMLAERTFTVPNAPKIQIFATDIDETALAAAREGFYTLNDAADVSPERLQRFFTKETDGYRIRRELRETVLFASHNIIKDPPFSRLDIITCRNLLIYLNTAAQKRVMEIFHFALNPGSYLFLGNSETVDGSSDLYAPVSKEHRVFQRRHVSPRDGYPVPDYPPAFQIAEAVKYAPGLQKESSERRVFERISYADLHQQMLEQYTPSVLVNEEYNIVHLSESAVRFMQMKGGEPTQNLLKLIRPELRLEIRTALYQAVERQTNVEITNVQFKEGARDETINIFVRPILQPTDTARGFILVLFEQTRETAGVPADAVYRSEEPFIRQLEDENVRLKAQLRVSAEQYEIQAEEFKASNEEQQAMNEELRASKEELETSREELQSVNEELSTVNQELKIKIEEISQTGNDLNNLINSTEIGTVFLDRTFRVQLFTPAARDIFNLIPADVGRPLSDIANKIENVDLLADVEKVLDKLQTAEREIHIIGGRVFMLRALPYRTKDDKINGVVLTFYDITERKRAEEAKFFLASIVESSQDSMLTINFDGIITSWNRAAESLYGYSAAEAIGKPLTMLTLPEDLMEILGNVQKIKRGAAVEIFDTFRLNKDGREMHLEVVLSPVRDASNQIIGVSTIARDVTERRRAEETVELDLKDTQTLQELSTRLVSEENVQTIYDEILAAAIALMRADAGTVQILDADSEQLVLLAHKNFEPKLTKRFERVGAGGKTACGIALKTGERTFVDFDGDNATDADGALRIHSQAGYLAAQSTPLIARSGKPIGMLNTHWRKAKHRPNERELSFLDLLARQAADLIEHHQIEQAMQKSEAKYHALFDSIDEGFCTIEVIFDENEQPVDFRYLETNPAFAKHTGIENATGKTGSELFPQLERRWIEFYGRVALTGEAARLEEEVKTVNGWFDVFASRVGGAGSRKVAVVFNDITMRRRMENDLRQSEERLRLLIESAVDFAIFTLSADGAVNYWNSGAEKVFGYAENEILGRSAAILFTHEDREKGVPEMEMQTALDKGQAPDERFHLRRDGSHFFASGVMFPLKNADGSLRGFVKIARDMTERIKAEQTERDKEMLQKLVGAQEDERRRIARDLHDELGQLLTGLRLKLDSIKNLCDDNEDLCAQINETQLLAKRVDDGIDFLAWELRPAVLDDLGLRPALGKYVREWSHYSGIEAELLGSGAKKIRLAPDVETHLYRIAQEALNNVHKHAQANSVEISLDKRGELVVLIIADDGSGFDADGKTNRTTGIGLIGMRERAALTGGSLEIESKPGKGTTVFVRVPASLEKKEN